MLFLFLSVLCSVIVGVIFKIARSDSNSPAQIVFFNYLVALSLSYLFFELDQKDLSGAPWAVYGLLGFLLPVVFLLLAASIKYMGIVKTDVAQRLSLIISILGAWFIFGEAFSVLKLTAVIIGIPAIVLILYKSNNKKENNWVYPGLVLFGFGLIDLLFKKLAMTPTVSFTASLGVVFSIAAVLMFFYNGYELLKNKMRFEPKNIGFGILVGLFNFGNILFYLKAHQAFAQSPSTVFAGMNMGVIILGSLVGVVFFKEKVTLANIVGLFMALLAVLLIVCSQLSS